MLEFMRKNANSKLAWLIIGAISLVFVFFGIGGSGGGGRLITVNGEEISIADYENMVRTISRNTMDSQAGMDPAEREKQVRSIAVSSLVSQTLIRQFGRNIGLEPSDRAIARQIYSIPEFQVDGKFSKQRYEEELGRRSTNDFENGTRKEMVANRTNALIGSLSQVYPPEAMQMYHFRSDLMRLEYLFFPSDRHKNGLSASADQLDAFYAQHQERWRLPATMKVEYVEIKPEDFYDQAEVTDEELKDAYNENIQRFTTQETADVSHILFKFPQMNPTESEKEAALNRAQSAADNINAENFAEMAQELSDDPISGPEGGQLGSLSMSMNLFGLGGDIFSLPVNTVSQPLESPIGYHLFMVSGKEAPRNQPLEEVRDVLEAELKTYKARQLAVAKLEDLIVRTETNPNLADAAESLGLEAQTSNTFTMERPAYFFEGNEAAVLAAFQAPIGRVADPVEERDHLVLFTPVERTESHIPPLDEVRASVVEAWTNYEAGRLAKLEALAFISQANAQGWEQAAGNVSGAREGESELLGRAELISAEPFNKANSMDFFASINSVAGAGQISPVPVLGEYEGEQGCFALYLAEFKPADEAGFDGMEGANIMVSESMYRSNIMHQIWLEELLRSSAANIHVPPMYN